MPTRRPVTAARIVRPLTLAAAAALAIGCATNRTTTRPAGGKPVEQQTLADLQAALPLPTGPCVVGPPASADALQAYAQGRDALLREQRTDAIRCLERAAELAPTAPGSALVWRDLGYARIGRDDAAAADAFRHAADADPTDADARLQLARLLTAADKRDEAAVQLQQARRLPDFAEDPGFAAVVDVLLGQHFERTDYRAAALECYENVLAILDTKDPALRGRPELADVLQRPGLLALRVADLATQAGRYPRAIELYRRLQRQEPQSAGMLELRLARVEFAAGDRASAARRGFGFVKTDGDSVSSWALFDALYAPHGGAAAALQDLNRLGPADAVAQRLLRSHLLVSVGDAAGAIDAVTLVGRTPADNADPAAITLPLARQTVHAFLAAGRRDDLIGELLRRTAERPEKWGVWSRAWAILTQGVQPDPLTPEKLLRVALPRDTPALVSARDYVLGTIYAAEGRPRAAAQRSTAATRAAVAFDAAAADTSPAAVVPGTAIGSGKELAVVIDAFRDDPQLLAGVIAEALRAGVKQPLAEAFADVVARRPGDAVLAVTQAQLLAAGEQRAEAVAALDRVAGRVTSARELYAVASQYAAFGDNKTAERLLRKAYAADAALPPVCNDLGYLLADQGRELDFAEQLLARAAAAEPDNSAYLDSLGWLLYKRGKFAESAARLTDAVTAADPADPVVLDHAGDALYRVNRSADAVARWQQAVDAIKARGTGDPQLRLRVEQKLRQAADKTPAAVAPVAKAG